MMSMMMGGAKYGVGGASIMTSPDMASSLSPDPPSPTHSDSSNSNVPPSSPSGSRGAPKECGVCGDIAKSMHFGGLSCDSCKAFFRRSVQNNAYKGFSCPYEKKCVIGVSSRKACQYCRFEKCLFIGMEKGWVMSEEERRKMMKQRLEKKQKETQENAQRQHESALYSLSEEDRREIASIVSLYKKAYNTIPYEEVPSGLEGGNGQSGTGGPMAGSFVLAHWMTFCKRIAYFFSLFHDFADLSASDQSLLLRTALTSAGIIMGSVVYDSSNGKWAVKLNRSRAKNLPNISSQNVEKLVPLDLITRVDKFFKKFQQICPDETMAMILILVSLYSPELMGLEARDRVQHLQERYIHILQNYVKFKFRERSSVMFPKAIVSLADIRELADRTGQMRIHDKNAALFPSMLHNAASGFGAMGSPDSGLSLSPMVPSSPSGDELCTVSGVRAPDNDPIYQRIMKVLYHTHGSSLNALTPTLLPLIIQILKKWAHARQEGRGGRSLTGSSRKSHRHPRPKPHRGSIQRPRRMSVKKESLSHEDMGLSIKEEVMDHSDDTMLQLGAEASHTMSSPGHYGHTQISPQDFENFPQIQQQHFQTPTICPPPTPPDLSHIHSNTSSSSLFQPLPDLGHRHSSDGSFMVPSQSPFPPEGSPIAYPYAMSPEEGSYHSVTQQQQQAPMSQSPQPIPLSPHVQTDSPHVPPMSPFPPPHQVMSPPPRASFQQQQDSQPSYAPLPPSGSPYSSSSSSSSPEDVETNQGDFLHEELTETEADVIMQLLDRVSRFDFLERGVRGSDILPLPLLKEFQSKLCSLTDSGSNPSSPVLFMEDVVTSAEDHQSCSSLSPGGSGTGGVMEHQPTAGMGICMEMDSTSLGMDPTMGLGVTTPMDMGADNMDVDQAIPMNN